MVIEVDRRALQRAALSHDASHYLLTPSGIARPRTLSDVAAMLTEATRASQPLAFRSGGTSLSGQGVTEHLLVDTRSGFRDIDVLDGGTRVRVGPGATVRQVNVRLSRLNRRLGPDPASEIACTIGGVIANNSSGMACGTHENTYRTLESMTFVLPSGLIVDSSDAGADELLRVREPELWNGLVALRDRVRANPRSVATIRRLFSMKNTMGYGLNAFLDFERPVDLLVHLLIGSEGTLGWVGEAVFRTVPVHSHVATGLLVVPSLADATSLLPELVAVGPATIELMDARSLRVSQGLAGAPPSIRDLAVAGHAALLVEVRAASLQELNDRVSAVRALAGKRTLSLPFDLTSDSAERDALWSVRKGLYPAVAHARPSGTTALLEDIAVPVERLLPTCTELTELFRRFSYDDAVIFGHAKDGNVHFLLTERFDSDEGIARYAAMTDAIVELVLAQGGTLKAEHGTGRIMAPFVQRQYGTELTDIMRELKRLCDPQGILNPGVLLSDDAEAHLRHLKTTPVVEEEVDRCVECGYCEPTCPSRSLTLTPRQRIVVRREIAAAEARGDARLAAELRRDEEYESVQTCAVDGMCAAACPVDINTGDLVRRLRAERPAPERAVWNALATRWGATTAVASRALSIADRLPAPLVRAASVGARVLAGSDRVPMYDASLPAGGARRSELLRGAASVVETKSMTTDSADALFLPACVGTMFGAEPSGIAGADESPGGATAAFLVLCERAGVSIATPEFIDALCCGTPWKSKGHRAGYDAMRDRVIDAVDQVSVRLDTVPIVSDASSCSEGFAATLASARPHVRVIDAVTFADEVLMPRLTVRRRVGRVLVHPTCSTEALDATDTLVRVASAFADELVVPESWGCCGFAGDRGMLHPELTAAATVDEVAAIARARRLHGEFEVAVSSNRTCEIGMTRATGLPYVHVLEALERATRP